MVLLVASTVVSAATSIVGHLSPAIAMTVTRAIDSFVKSPMTVDGKNQSQINACFSRSKFLQKFQISKFELLLKN